MKAITAYKVAQHGKEYSQYFQGAGLAFTAFTDLATGAGFTEKEALEDALEQLAQNDWDTDCLEKLDGYKDATCSIDCNEDRAKDDEQYWYVSVYVK